MRLVTARDGAPGGACRAADLTRAPPSANALLPTCRTAAELWTLAAALGLAIAGFACVSQTAWWWAAEERW